MTKEKLHRPSRHRLARTLLQCVAVTGLFWANLAPASDIPLMFQRELLAKASPDECFFGLGNTNNTFSPTGIVCEACLQAGGKPKVNQGYVWGLARAGDDFWMGTGPNINSLVSGGYMNITNPILNEAYAAEFGLSAFAQAGLVPPALGDWRPPDIFVYNLQQRSLVRMDETMTTNGQALLNETSGLRSAGASAPNTAHTNGVVILAGPSLNAAAGGGIIMFAFNAANRAFLDARRFPQYANIRKWLLHQGVLYTAVASTNASGYVLRWINDPANPQYPFAFSVVGNLDNGGAELAIHAGRMFVSTWPGLEGQNPDFTRLVLNPVGIIMSPVIPSGGLTSSHAGGWQKCWDIMDYEIDTVVGAVTAMGALKSFGGYLYWGTMNVPGLNYYAHAMYFGAPTNSTQQRQVYNDTRRAVSIFRGSNFKESPLYPWLPATADVELLYGETNLAARSISSPYPWSTNQNASGQSPKYGKSGFGFRHNTYTWTMDVYQNQLFVGTLNESGAYSAPEPEDGAHLYCFTSANKPAQTVSQHGVGNYSSYGVRTILADSNSLYLGMANPMNLLTDPNDAVPDGGWELVRLTQVFSDQDWDNLPDQWESWYFGGITNALPDMDSDGDMTSNLAEFVAGTNPTNGLSCFSITNVAKEPDGDFSFTWPGHTGRIYHVMQASDLAGPWTVSGVITGGNGTLIHSLPAGTNRFSAFRVQAELAPGQWNGP